MGNQLFKARFQCEKENGNSEKGRNGKKGQWRKGKNVFSLHPFIHFAFSPLTLFPFIEN
jgi:hypothetical protein